MVAVPDGLAKSGHVRGFFLSDFPENGILLEENGIYDVFSGIKYGLEPA